MDLPSRHVLYLAKRIGARGAGTDGEAAAASYVLRAFRDLDLQVDMETFSSWKSDMQGLALIYLLTVITYLVFFLSYPIGLAMIVLIFFIFQVETYTWAVTSRILPHSSASNVIGRVRPKGSARQKVLIVANYDSAQSSPLGGPKISRAFRLLYVLSFISILAILIVGVIGVGATLTKVSKSAVQTVWLFASVFPAYLAVLCLVILWGESRGRYTAGTNDNASGVGVMLAVMSSVGTVPLENTEVWGVATGRGFAGARGMVAFLHRHRHTMRDAYIINLDHCGIGDTKVLTREGTMLGFRSSGRLKKMAFQAAARGKGIELSKGKCRVKKSDAMAAIVRRYRAITIGGVSGGTYPGWRNTDDTLDTIERATLDRTAKLVNLLLEEIDSGERARRIARTRRSTGEDDDLELESEEAEREEEPEPEDD